MAMTHGTLVTTELHGLRGSRATGPELRWPLVEGEAPAGDSLSARRKRLGGSHAVPMTTVAMPTIE